MPNRCSPIGLIDFPDRTARHSSTNFDRESSRFHRARGEIEGEELRPNGAPSLVIKGQKKRLTNRRIPYIWTESSETTVYFIRKVSSRSQDGYTGSRSLEGDLQSCEVCQVWRVDGPITTHGTAVARRRSYPKTPVNKTDKMASASMTMAAAPVARTTRLVSARRAFSAALLMSGKKQTLSGAQIAR